MVLQASVVGIVMVAAIVHATWNALAKAAHEVVQEAKVQACGFSEAG